MFFISIALLFGVGFTLLFYFLIPLSAWYLFLWVPVGFICGVILLVLLLYIYLLIGSKTSSKLPSKHFLLRRLCKFCIHYMHVKIVHEGIENVPDARKDTFIIYANHKSNMDPMLIYVDLHQKITAVGKKTLFTNHFMMLIAKTYGAVVMDRDNDREAAKTMVKAIKDVKNGQSMIIFPEGGIKTRDVEEMVSLRAGAYKLAMKPEVLILPVSIIGSSHIAKDPRRKKKIVKIIYHKPITPLEYKGKTTTEVGNMVEQLINKDIENNKEK
ncbi:MAG: 1-acyl-sn-glycerol-3-phosphate acyltransferase [Acholeplasmatales bacterium]|nr:1-acyl-sn-glycerol-3-phosphate acyltransferase [Acholeplasmatales bacterium]